MNAVSSARFSALAGYSRQPNIVPTIELEWYEEHGERLLGVIIQEMVGEEYGGIILGRDGNGRFRWIDGTRFGGSIAEARVALEQTMRKQAEESDESFLQGDETHTATRLLDPIVPPDRMHPIFRELISDSDPHYSAARSIIATMSPYFRDLDGNFIQQFQTTAFDARLFELYLFAALHEIGYAFDQSYSAPDYHCVAPGIEFFVEAVTANPTNGTVALDPIKMLKQWSADLLKDFEGEVAIKVAGPLNSKLRKKYWERPHVAGKPLIIAIQNFSAPMAMTQTSTTLGTYLYGWRHIPSRDKDGHLIITPESVAEHRNGDKVIPSNFFGFPGAEHISAVMFNPHATITKFNRIGVIAGFGSDRVKLVRVGMKKNHDPDAAMPTPFSSDVQDPSYTESWIEGMSVYHNPNALCPVDRRLIPDSAHHFLQSDGQILSYTPEYFPMGSVTKTIILQE